MDLPFTRDAFFEVFGHYNMTVWPLIILFYLLCVVATGFLARARDTSGCYILLVLAAMWLVNAILYHGIFFRSINPAAVIFSAAFLLQTVLFATHAARKNPPRFSSDGTQGKIGLSLVMFSAVIYPAWGFLAGHAWPQVPAFGVAPCPTTIFTAGILLMGAWRETRWLRIIPALWAGLGGSAAILLGVPQDYSLFAVFALLVFLRR